MVIAIIVLLLALAVPAFNAMSTESRFSQAVQNVNGVLTRARIASTADGAMIAVRFSPAAWNLDETGMGAADQKRQTAVTYRYTTSVEDPDEPQEVVYDERFIRRKESVAVRLPIDVWVAPAEGLLAGNTNVYGRNVAWSDFVLDGEIGAFEFDVTANGSDLLNADDFLVVFDPQMGVMGAGRPRAYPLRAYDPASEQERGGEEWNSRSKTWTKEFRRFAFSGLVLYAREPFTTLGAAADAQQRQELLGRIGRAYYVDRRSGTLVPGSQEGP